MKKITITFIFVLLAIICSNAAPITRQVAAPDDLLTTFNAANDGDIIELTTSGGAYTWSSKISNLTKSFTLKAADGLLVKPTITLPVGVFIATVNNTVAYSVTLSGIDFNGNAGATSISTPKAAAGGDFNITVTDCVFRNFASTATMFGYAATGTGWAAALKWYGSLTVSNSKFIGPFATVANFANSYGGASTASFTNCYIEGGTNTMLGNIAGNNNTTTSYTVDHCTFVNAGGATGTEFNVKNGGTSTTIVKNSIFINNPGGNATKVIAVGTNPGNAANTNNGVLYSGTVPLIGVKYPTALLGTYLTTDPMLDTDGFATTTAYLSGPTDGKPRGFFNASTSPWISLSTGSIAALGYNGVGPDAAAKSFSVAGINLGTDITVTPSANIEISQNGTSFSRNAITLSATANTVASTIIYVRLVASLTPNTYTGTVLLSSSGAATKTLTLSGIVTVPTITSSNYALAQYDYFTGLGPSPQQAVTLNATNLTANLIITPPENFEISLTSGTNFSTSPITITPNGTGNIIDNELYIRMISGLQPNTYNGNVTLTSADAITKTMTVVGGVMNKPNMSVSNYYYLNYVLANGPSNQQTIVLEGGGLTNDVNVSLPINSSFEMSLLGDTSFSATNPIIITQTNGILVFTAIYVRLKAGLGINNYTDILTLTSTGSNSISAVLDGNVTSSASPAPQKGNASAARVLRIGGQATTETNKEVKKVSVFKVIVK